MKTVNNCLIVLENFWMEYDVAYASNQLMEKLELKSREGFRRNYLKHALELNLVSMTIPDKPNSKNQRYIKK